MSPRLLIERLRRKNKEAFEPSFNIGDALYKQGKYTEAANQFESITEHKLKDKDLANVYHNLGNSLLNEKKFKEEVLMHIKTRFAKILMIKKQKYNLSYAMKMLQQQQQQQQNKDKTRTKIKTRIKIRIRTRIKREQDKKGPGEER